MQRLYYNVIVSSICPNGYEDVRSYNEVDLDRVNRILVGLKPDDRATVIYLFGREIEKV